MKKFILFLFIIAISTMPAQAQLLEEEVNGYLNELTRLNPKNEGINLRSGPGTNFEAVSQTYDGLSFLASKTMEKDLEGKDWYKIAFMVEIQEETAYYEPDSPCYIRSDLVSVYPLTDFDKQRAASEKFNILTVSSDGKPAFALDHPLTLYKFNFEQKEEVVVPAGRALLLFSMIWMRDGVPFINIYEPYAGKWLHSLGEIPLAEFEALSFGSAEAEVRAWLEKNKEYAGL
ncbi:MAG: hypothetical protein IJD04_05225 [Desulfovibrionaceae bacterium]|nr:hypothetical protein [Desulfovibrionaceae bacterium]